MSTLSQNGRLQSPHENGLSCTPLGPKNLSTLAVSTGTSITFSARLLLLYCFPSTVTANGGR